jgi:hypothetical protein
VDVCEHVSFVEARRRNSLLEFGQLSRHLRDRVRGERCPHLRSDAVHLRWGLYRWGRRGRGELPGQLLDHCEGRLPLRGAESARRVLVTPGARGPARADQPVARLAIPARVAGGARLGVGISLVGLVEHFVDEDCLELVGRVPAELQEQVSLVLGQQRLATAGLRRGLPMDSGSISL